MRTQWCQHLFSLISPICRLVEMSKPGASTAAPVTYQFAQRPKELTFLEFVYNKETGEILGRTPISWCK